MVYNLPCTFPEDQHRILPRKRKVPPVEEVNSSFLTPMVTSQGPVLCPSSDESPQEGKSNSNNNNVYNANGSYSTPFLRTLFSLKHGGRTSPASSLSSSPSPTAFLERKLSGDAGLPPPAKRLATDMLAKVGRPRLKSMAQEKPKKGLPRSRSKSSENTSNKIGISVSLAQTSGSNTFTPICFTGASLNSNNSNNSNSCNVSPPGGAMLSVPLTQFRPLPITPPRNPFEDQPVVNRQLDPKTLKYLHQHK